jgi:hypothetical protein
VDFLVELIANVFLELIGELILTPIVELSFELMTEVFKLPLQIFHLSLQRRDSSLELTLLESSHRGLSDLRIDILGLSTEQVSPPPATGGRYQWLRLILQLPKHVLYFLHIREIMHALGAPAKLTHRLWPPQHQHAQHRQFPPPKI